MHVKSTKQQVDGQRNKAKQEAKYTRANRRDTEAARENKTITKTAYLLASPDLFAGPNL